MKQSGLLNEIDVLHTRLSALRPLPSEAVKRIEEALTVEYTYESNRIEGNTLTLQETALVIEEGVTVAGKSMREHLEAINHAQAIDFIRDLAQGNEPISERTVKDIHGLILHGIDRENAGRYRTVPVMISGSRHTPPAPYLIAGQMEDFINEYRRMETERTHPVGVAAFLHDELVKIHPFIDGNGRTGRLLMNLYLLRRGYPIVSLKADDAAKLAYYNALEISHTEGKRVVFTDFVGQAVRNALIRYLAFVEGNS